MSDFDEAIDRVVAGLERKSRVMSPKEKEIVANHEAGHAIIAELRPHADRVAKISIIPRGVAALGYTRQQPSEDRYLLTQAELLDRLDVMGGRVAEELISATADRRARRPAARHRPRSRHGYQIRHERAGPADAWPQGKALFLDVPVPAWREYSEATARLIDQEVRRLLTRHARCSRRL
jgi:cell division protease FtsH